MVLGAGGAAWQSLAPAPKPCGVGDEAPGAHTYVGSGMQQDLVGRSFQNNVDGALKTMIWKAGLESGISVSGFSQGGRQLAKLS